MSDQDKQLSLNEKYFSLNKKTEDLLKTQRSQWVEKVEPLVNTIKEGIEEMYEMQATALSYRHIIGDEINFYTTKLSKAIAEQKRIRKDKLINYTLKFQVKLNTSEKNVCIDADTSEMERYIELLQMHIEFLRESVKTLDNLQFAVKNKIALLDYLLNK
jgi:FtsZ-binding cell division protein ZapB